MTREPDCLFCGIAAGDIPSKQVHTDDLVVAFHDISPRAPTHILLVPREHIRSAADLTDEHAPIVGHLLAIAAQLAREQGIEQAGYRIVTNVGRGAGQSVDHLHLHLMGGRPMAWPPG